MSVFGADATNQPAAVPSGRAFRRCSAEWSSSTREWWSRRRRSAGNCPGFF